MTVPDDTNPEMMGTTIHEEMLLPQKFKINFGEEEKILERNVITSKIQNKIWGRV